MLEYEYKNMYKTLSSKDTKWKFKYSVLSSQQVIQNSYILKAWWQLLS